VVKTVRARLTATSPEWRAFADNEQKIRTEKQPVVADEIASGRP
jgi:transcription initiation factor TFIIIB Brf1 subunit/transcription initiation factor TFIIB